MKFGIALSMALLLATTSLSAAQSDPEDIPPPLPVPDTAGSYEQAPPPQGVDSGQLNSSEEIRAYHFGVSALAVQGGLKIVGVLVDSPAKVAGVKPGDTISRINGGEANSSSLMGTIESVEIERAGRRQTLSVHMGEGSSTSHSSGGDPYGRTPQYESTAVPAPQSMSRVHSYSVPQTTYSAPQRYYVTPGYQSQRYYDPPSAYQTRYYGYRPSASIYFRPSPNVTIGIGNGVGVYGYPGYPGPGYYGRGFGYGPGYGMGPGRGRGGVGISIGGVGIRF